MSVKALEKLRSRILLKDVIVRGERMSDNDEAYKRANGYANKLADEIEAEIAEKYMELPVDADGVPINVGDELFNKNKPTDVYTVTAIADNGYIRIYHDTAHIHSSQCRHVKTDPIKDLLEKFWRETDGIVFPGDKGGLLEKKKDEYAGRIRELMKEGGE